VAAVAMSFYIADVHRIGNAGVLVEVT